MIADLSPAARESAIALLDGAQDLGEGLEKGAFSSTKH